MEAELSLPADATARPAELFAAVAAGDLGALERLLACSSQGTSNGARPVLLRRESSTLSSISWRSASSKEARRRSRELAELLGSVDETGRTALHMAVAQGDLRAMDVLIAAGARLDAVDQFGLTPLGEAARHASRTGENKVRDKLLAAGANAAEPPEAREHTRRLVATLGLVEVLILVLYATCTRFGPAVFGKASRKVSGSTRRPHPT